MDDLIAALTILRKYGNPLYPTHCEHEVMYVVDIEAANVSAEDVAELERLGFHVDSDNGGFYSFKFGSA